MLNDSHPGLPPIRSHHLFALSLIALGAALVSGCGNDCAAFEQTCNRLTVESAQICQEPGRCKVDGAPASCDFDAGCRIVGPQKLTVNYHDAQISPSATPDLVIAIAVVDGGSGSPGPANVTVTLDGVPGVVTGHPGSSLIANWPENFPPSPRTLELSVSGVSTSMDVRLLFEDIDCPQNDLRSCHAPPEE